MATKQPTQVTSGAEHVPNAAFILVSHCLMKGIQLGSAVSLVVSPPFIYFARPQYRANFWNVKLI